MPGMNMSDTKGERPLRTATARDARSRVLLWIEQYIRANKPGVGEALPAELEIARSLRVGRSSVREALSALKVLGIVQSAPQGRHPGHPRPGARPLGTLVRCRT